MKSLPDSEHIIIGGGAVGLGAAYALARAGVKDLLVLEAEEEVGRVTTSQGAGLCGQPRESVERVRLAMHSVRVFRELQASTVPPDWHEVGSLRIALSDRRVEELRRLKAASDAAGLETHLISRQEGERLFPLMDLSKAKGILWCPTDGWMTPQSVAQSYAHACGEMGVRIARGTRVEEILLREGRVAGVRTNRGQAACRQVINAAGAHAYHIARLAGLELPIIPVRHEYYITLAMEGMTPSIPCFRIPELTLYGRARDGGLLLGGWEPRSVHTDPRGYPIEGTPPAIEPDWRVLGGFEASFEELLPASRGKGKQRVGKGWPTFTPDGRFIIGESRRVPGFVMAGGCNAHGISGSGGIGRLLVESLLEPHPSDYVQSLSPDRFTETSWTWEQARVDAAHVYETYYGV